MKKSFELTSSRHRPDRQVEYVKHEINKYLGRERRKALPEGVDYWDFDCKVGATEEAAAVVMVTEISKKIDEVVAGNSDKVYIEILAKPGIRYSKSNRSES